MVYVPTNVGAYVAAYSGAIAGMAVSGWITDPTSADYAQVTVIAGAFAQEFDTIWANATALNNLEVQAIGQIVSEDFSKRGPGPLANAVFATPSNWLVSASACAALVLQSDAFFAGQGINPGTPGTGAVSSVFARTGAVVAQNGDYAAGLVTNDSSVAGATVKDALNTINTAGFGVRSVFARTGAVLSATGDYVASQVNNDSLVTGATVAAALNTLRTASGVSSVFARTGAVVAASGDYRASQVSNDSSVSGATVADALNTLNTGLGALVVNAFIGRYYVNPAFAGTSTGSSSNPFTTIAAAFAFGVAQGVAGGIIYLPPGAKVVENVVFPTTGSWEIATDTVLGFILAGITGTVDVSTTAAARRALTRLNVSGAVSGNAGAGACRFVMTDCFLSSTLTLTVTGGNWRCSARSAPIEGPAGGPGTVGGIITGAVSVAANWYSFGYNLATSLTFSGNSQFTFGDLPPSVTYNGAGAGTLWLNGTTNDVGGPITFNAPSGALTVNIDGAALTEMQRVGMLITGTVTTAAQNGGRSVMSTVANNVGATTILQQCPKSLLVADAELTVLSSGTLGASCGLNIIYTDLTGTLVTRALTPLLDITSAVGTKVAVTLPFAQNGATAIQYSLTGVGVAGPLSLAISLAVRQAS